MIGETTVPRAAIPSNMSKQVWHSSGVNLIKSTMPTIAHVRGDRYAPQNRSTDLIDLIILQDPSLYDVASQHRLQWSKS